MLFFVVFIENNNMTYSNRNLSRNERQRQLNLQLSVLPTFTPVNDYQVHHINRSTSPMLLHELIEIARKTTNFTIDTEHDCYTHQAALIQIEFIQQKSIVLLIETCHLPHASSVLFWLIRSLMKMIFKPSNVIYSWGDAICELRDFIPYGLFSIHTVRHMNTIDVQHHFKQWYNTIFKHSCGLQPFEDDHTVCTCSYRLVKDKTINGHSKKQLLILSVNFLINVEQKAIGLDISISEMFHTSSC